MSVFESIAWVTLAAFCLQQMKIVDVAGLLKDNGVNLPKAEQVSPPSASPTTGALSAPSPTPSVSPSPEVTGTIAP